MIVMRQPYDFPSDVTLNEVYEIHRYQPQQNTVNSMHFSLDVQEEENW